MIRNPWQKTIDLVDVWNSTELSFAEKRDIVVERVRKSGWPNENSVLSGLLDQMTDLDDVQEFDFLWDQVYDEADWDRVWISTS